MYKWKTALLLLLVTAAIVGCGALPEIAGSVADGINQNVAAFAPMNAISFTPVVPETDTVQYYLDRLALHGNMYSMPVKEHMATMTQQQILTAAREQVQVYESLGVWHPFEECDVYAESFFAIKTNDVEKTAVYWTVYATATTDPSGSLLLYLDDATGKIISINYESAKDLFDNNTSDQRRQRIEQLAMTFMAQFAPENDTLAGRVFEVNEVRFGKNSTCYEYTLSGFEQDQTEYVKIRVMLYDRGFQITCSSE